MSLATLMTWLFGLPEPRPMCEIIGHNLQWVYGWNVFVCQRCGLTIRNPNEPAE